MHIKNLCVLALTVVTVSACGGQQDETGSADAAAIADAGATAADPGANPTSSGGSAATTPDAPTGAAAGVADASSDGQSGAAGARGSSAGAASDSGDPARAGGTGGSTTAAGADNDARGDDAATGPAHEAGSENVADRVQAQADPAAILRATAARYESIRSLQARFEMLTESPLLRSRTASQGILYQRSPDRIKLDFTEPAGDVVVSDGEFIWTYYPSADPQQAIRVPAGRGGGASVDLKAQFVGDPVQRFSWQAGGIEDVAGRPAHVLTLTPRQELSYALLKVWIDAEDALVRRFEVTEHNGTIRHMELSELQLNPTIADSVFEFEAPPGVRVVRG